MFGAELSWCQIVRCQIVLVPNCPGAKLSTFIILVLNCPLLLSWCQIVPFIILVPNCPVPNCPVPNCPVPNCPTTMTFHSSNIFSQLILIKTLNAWRMNDIERILSHFRFMNIVYTFLINHWEEIQPIRWISKGGSVWPGIAKKEGVWPLPRFF